ncbi:MAG: hypothetical protein COA58_09870 [Bacteroidetes bacterium]|nr:MAG: hypothetical protein COA58_13075 [Bacteroidota bacterium]PCJ65161.1 MAG: hypothetical protein COA58_09870 [Bacteroidota bacterium]
MRTIFVLIASSLLITSFGQQDQRIADELKSLNDVLSNSNSIVLEFTTTVLNMQDGTTTSVESVYRRKNNQYYSKQGAVVTIQNKAHKLTVDEENASIILSPSSAIAAPKTVDYLTSLSHCKTKQIKDTAGKKIIEMTFSEDYPVNFMTVVIKDNLPTKLMMQLKDNGESFLVTIDYSKVNIRGKVSENQFNTQKYIDSKNVLSAKYKTFKLYNLIKA